MEKINKSFKQGKGIIFIMIADQLLNPKANLESGTKVVHKSFNTNAIRNASNNYVHESWAHGLPWLRNKNYKEDRLAEHENYHNEKTETSPSVEDYDKNPNKFKDTPFGKTMKKIDKEVKKIK